MRTKKPNVPEKAYGFDVRVTFNNGDAPKVFHTQKKSQSAALRWAIFKPNAADVEIADSYTQEQWERTHGLNQRM